MILWKNKLKTLKKPFHSYFINVPLIYAKFNSLAQNVPLALDHWLRLTDSLFPPCITMTYHWIAGFLDFSLSGFLDFWYTDSAGSVLHSLALHSLAFFLHWNICYCNCCHFFRKNEAFSPAFFDTSHYLSTSV